MRILVVDDDAAVREALRRALQLEGYEVELAGDGAEALDRLKLDSVEPDALLLDVSMPRLDGLEVCRRLRRGGSRVPVLMLTARREEADRIQGLSLGADDYLTKPFSPQELVLRVGAILRRVGSSGAGGQDALRIGPIVIDRGEHKVTIDDQEIELTPTEFKLLLTLVERRGRVQSRSHLLETVWDAAPDIQTRTVDMHVQRLRGKLGVAGELIETVRGFGYRIRAGSSRGQ